MTTDALLDQTPNRLRRFACMMYEAVLLFGVVFLAGYLLDTLTQSKNALELRGARQAWLFVAIGAYFVLCWRRRGQTLPMKTWNIRLVDRDGNTPSTPRLMLRYVSSGRWCWPARRSCGRLPAPPAGLRWTCSSSPRPSPSSSGPGSIPTASSCTTASWARGYATRRGTRRPASPQSAASAAAPYTSCDKRQHRAPN